MFRRSQLLGHRWRKKIAKPDREYYNSWANLVCTREMPAASDNRELGIYRKILAALSPAFARRIMKEWSLASVRPPSAHELFVSLTAEFLRTYAGLIAPFIFGHSYLPPSAILCRADKPRVEK